LSAPAPLSLKKNKTKTKKTTTLCVLDFNVNITNLFSLCTSDGYHFTIDKQLM